MGKKEGYQMWGQMYSVSGAGDMNHGPVLQQAGAQPTKFQFPAGLPDTLVPASRALNV